MAFFRITKNLIFLTFATILNPLFATHIPVLSDLSLDEKIGQLIMIASVSSLDRNQNFMLQSPYQLDPSYVENIIQKYHIGGIIFMGAGIPEEQYQMSTHFQDIARYPLMVGLDAEWGLSMRLQER